VEHGASVKHLHLFLWFSNPLTFLQDFSISVISSSVALLEAFLGCSLLLALWGFHSNTSFSIAPAGFLKVCPIQLHILFLTWMSVGSCFVISHSSYLILCLAILCLKYALNAYLQRFFVYSCLLLMISMFHRHEGGQILD
jgi:hypothetical protein